MDGTCGMGVGWVRMGASCRGLGHKAMEYYRESRNGIM